MTRRGAPTISRSDLRDHATPERIDRIWERIDADLSVPDMSPGASSRMMVGVLAAVVASLAGGVLLGKLIWDQPNAAEVSAAPTVAAAPPENDPSVFAAGTQGRSYPLPGGGHLQLSPGTTVEVVRHQGDALELRLVQGEATIDTAGASSQKLVALVAGEAMLSTQGGGVVRVRRNEHDLDISVADGEVSVRSPDGSHQVAKGDPVLAVPLRRVRPTARLMAPAPEGSSRVEVVREAVPVQDSPAISPTLPDWQARSRVGDTQEALRLLRAQPGGVDGAIQAAGDADALWEIHDVAIRHDPVAAYRALTRVAEAFPGDASAQLAAYKLGNYYRRAGQHDQANKWFARTAESSEGILAEDALCKQFRTSPNPEEARKFAQEYLVRYPDGRCKREADRFIAGESSDNSEEETAIEPSSEDRTDEEEPK